MAQWTGGNILEWADRQQGSASGALLSVRECRAGVVECPACPGCPGSFGPALLALAEMGKVCLHHADHPRMAPDGVDNPGRLDHAGRPMRVIGFTLRW